MVYQIVLEDAGYECTSYTDPVKALQEFKPYFYDLILLDIKMPVLNGFELCRKIREVDRSVHIIFITASEYYEQFRTLHSFRRFVKTVISDQTNTDYSEWFLGHNKSPYYTKKEPERREIYATKCMKYLTFLDYTKLEATGKNIEAKLSEKEKEIQLLRQRDSMNTDAIASLSDNMTNDARDRTVKED